MSEESIMRYAIVIEQAETNFAAYVPDLPGCVAIGDTEEDRLSANGVFWLPAYHDMGLIGGILTPLYMGGRSVLIAPTSFLQRPMRWLQAIHDYRTTISGAPNSRFMNEFDVICPTYPAPRPFSLVSARSKSSCMNGTLSAYLP